MACSGTKWIVRSCLSRTPTSPSLFPVRPTQPRSRSQVQPPFQRCDSMGPTRKARAPLPKGVRRACPSHSLPGPPVARSEDRGCRFLTQNQAACAVCSARKVRCDGQRPACSACLRTAKHKRKDLGTIVCQYGSSSAAPKTTDRARRGAGYADSESDGETDSEPVDSRKLLPRGAKAHGLREWLVPPSSTPDALQKREGRITTPCRIPLLVPIPATVRRHGLLLPRSIHPSLSSDKAAVLIYSVTATSRRPPRMPRSPPSTRLSSRLSPSQRRSTRSPL